VRRERPELRLVLTGEGDFGALPDGVEARGRVSTDELVELYRGASAVVFPSLYEGFGMPVVEAMACGAPVAATDVGDVRSIIGELGEVVAPKNPELLCAAWRRLRQRLAREPGLRKEAREEIVANYGLDAMVRRTEDILSQLTAGRRAQDIAREFT
jgi:glycosyltransferase involved in cell wall biosynthesis